MNKYAIANSVVERTANTVEDECITISPTSPITINNIITSI